MLGEGEVSSFENKVMRKVVLVKELSTKQYCPLCNQRRPVGELPIRHMYLNAARHKEQKICCSEKIVIALIVRFIACI